MQLLCYVIYKMESSVSSLYLGKESQNRFWKIHDLPQTDTLFYVLLKKTNIL